MSRYLTKYKDQYRVIADYDLTTNDYPRLDNGMLDPSFEDIKIKCKNNCYIYHYGHSTLVGVVPTTKRGHNILRRLHDNLIGDSTDLSWNEVHKALIASKHILKIEETDAELFFYFKDKSMPEIAKVLEPSSFGAGTSPFSTRNLPKTKYAIPEADLTQFTEITADVPKERMYIIAQAVRNFSAHISTKKWSLQDIKADMKKQGLSGKDYWHKNGYWTQFIDFVKTYISDNT